MMHVNPSIKRKILLKRLSDFLSCIVSKFWEWVVDPGLEPRTLKSNFESFTVQKLG